MTLRIYIDQWHDAASPCAWVSLDAAGAVRETGHGPLASMPPDDDTTLILAAARVLATAAVLPKVRRSRLETALPFVLEDALLDDAHEMHVTPGGKQEDGRTILYAVNRHWLLQILAAATAAKLRVHRVVPEYCLLPLRTQEWSLAWDGAQGFLATAPFLGMALDRGSIHHAPAALQLQLRQQAPAALRLFMLGGDMALPAWDVAVPVIHERQVFDWRKAEIPVAAPNLLWGKLAPPPRIRELWPWLRPALLAALLLFCVEATLGNLEWAMFAHEKHQLDDAMKQTFRETFGAEATIVDAPLQMRRNVAFLRHAAGHRDDSDFSPLLDRFAAATESLPSIRLRTLRYADGKLDIELALPAAAADALPQRLVEAGLSAQWVDKREIGGEAVAQLRIAAGGMR